MVTTRRNTHPGADGSTRRQPSVKYEEVYLHGYANGTEARAGLSRYFAFYNDQRTHQSHEYWTPDEVYFGLEPPHLAKAA